MSDTARIEDLATRKRLLVAECEAHRQELKLEFAELESAAAATLAPLQSMFSISRLALMVAPLAGFMLGRGKRGIGGWMKMALVGWQAFKRVQPLLARFRRRPEND